MLLILKGGKFKREFISANVPVNFCVPYIVFCLIPNLVPVFNWHFIFVCLSVRAVEVLQRFLWVCFHHWSVFTVSSLQSLCRFFCILLFHVQTHPRKTTVARNIYRCKWQLLYCQQQRQSWATISCLLYCFFFPLFCFIQSVFCCFFWSALSDLQKVYCAFIWETQWNTVECFEGFFALKLRNFT